MITEKFIEDGVKLSYWGPHSTRFEFYLIIGDDYFGFFADLEKTNKEIERCEEICKDQPNILPWPALEYLSANKDFIYAEAIKLKIKSDL